ncbi:MAG TPA: transmembrane 220 family protein [Agriterribacter sp.]|nr:transmembrane 220 family protein [Chitinophagaceae bacterium]HRP31164.1 transmembrane 220 family protein [Agriterribacter sp.]
MRIFNITFCLLFVVSAALQYNDPDPWVWIPLYLFGAACCWQAFRNRYYPVAYLAGMLGYGIYALYKLLERDGAWDWLTKHDAANIAATMKAETPWIEDTREFFGLVILIVVLLVNYLYAKRKNDRQHSTLRAN